MGALGLGRIEAGRPAVRSRRLTAWLVFVALIALVNWASRIGGGPPPKDAAYQWDIAAGSVIQFVFLLAVVLLLARGAWELLALRRPLSWAGAVGTALLVLLAVNIVNVALEPILHPGREQGLTPNRWEPDHAAAFAVFAFAVVVMAPVTEELAFRGLGYGLLRPFGLLPPIVGSSFVWALAHGLLDALPVITLLGIGLAWLRHRQRSTIPGILLHATFNGLALAASLLT